MEESRKIFGIGYKRISLYLVAIITCIIFIFPVYWLFTRGFMPEDKILSYPPQIIPKSFTLNNIIRGINEFHTSTYIKNTIFVVFSTTIGSVISCSIVSYGFARINFKGKNILFVLLLSGMMIPWDVTIIPLFVMYSKIGWTNSFLPLIVPSFFVGYQGAFFVFLMRQFVMGIPYSLDEAAYIDGCNRLQIFTRIILPLMKPAIATVIIYQFMYAWNDFIYPLIFLDDASSYTLSLGLYFMKTPFETPWGAMMGTAAVACLVPVIVFFITQDKLLGGITVSGMKG